MYNFYKARSPYQNRVRECETAVPAADDGEALPDAAENQALDYLVAAGRRGTMNRSVFVKVNPWK